MNKIVRLFETTIPLNEQGLLIDSISNGPISIVSASVNDDPNNPLVHYCFEASGMTSRELQKFSATPIKAPYHKPGYSGISFVANDRSTGLVTVATDITAVENPNFESFQLDLIEQVFNKDGFIARDKTKHTELVLTAPTTDRVLYGVADNTWKIIPLQTLRGQTQFVVGYQSIGQIKVGEKSFYGLPTEQIYAYVTGQQKELAWQLVATLDEGVNYTSRAWQNGGVLVQSKDNDGSSIIEAFRLWTEKGDVHMDMQDIAPATIDEKSNFNQYALVGRTTVGADTQNQPVIAALRPNGGDMPVIDLMSQESLPQDVIALVTGMDKIAEGFSYQAAAASA
jgi:hypothetical protein